MAVTVDRQDSATRLAPELPGPTSRVPIPAPSAPIARKLGLELSISHALDRRRLFLLAPFAVIAGLLAYLASPVLPDLSILGFAGIALVLALVVVRNSLSAVRLVSLALSFWFGVALLAIHGTAFGTAMLGNPQYGTYEMRVDEILRDVESGTRIIVSDITPTPDARPVPMRRARIIVPQDMPLAPGDRIRGPIRFYPVPGPVVPNGFDSQLHAYFDGIGAYGNATRDIELVTKGMSSTPEYMIDSIRRGIATRIDAALPQPSAGIARALITGDQSEVPEQARDTMATAGLAHVLSISGLHLSLVAGLVLVALRVALAPFVSVHAILSVKHMAAAGAVMAALGYFAISGGSVAALRSTIMLVLVLGAVLFGRRALTMRNVAIAALVVLALDPASVFRASFQLSFSAVVALIAVWEVWRPSQRLKGDTSFVGRVGGYLGGIALTSLVAGLATLLFSIYHFQQTSPLGILGNLFSLSIVGFLMMPSALLAALLMPLGLEQVPLWVMGWSIDRMLDIGSLVAGWSAGLDHSPLLQPSALMIGLASFAWFTFLETWHRLIAPVLAVPLIALLALDQPPDVLVADTTQAVAVRTSAGLALVSGRSNSFAVDVWRETYGDPIEVPSPVLCDSIGCFGESSRGFKIAIIRDPAGFHEDCQLADLVVARRDIPITCRATATIGPDDLLRGGVHWLRWDEKRADFEIRPAIPDRDRPWRPTP